MLQELDAAATRLRRVPESEKHFVAPFSSPFDELDIGDPAAKELPTSRLFIGPLGGTRDAQALASANISTCISITDREVPRHDGVVYWQYRVPDESTADLRSLWPEICRRIDDGLARGSVLVHCDQGVSRSGATVAAYIARRCNLSRDAALAQVRSRRGCVRPNDGFLRQLADWAPCGAGSSVGIGDELGYSTHARTVMAALAVQSTSDAAQLLT